MYKEPEEDILHITEQYVAEIQAGRQPNLSDYLARYPEYADQITDFIAYYHTVEADLPTQPDIMPHLSNDFQIATNSAWKRVLQPDSVPAKKLSSLLVTAKKKHLTLSQLADKIGLSVDIASKLEQRKIKASSIPQEIYNRLAEVLQQPLGAIQAYFESASEQPSYRSQLAEAQAVYQVQEPSDIQIQTFRQAVEESTQLSEERRREWHDILNREGLEGGSGGALSGR